MTTYREATDADVPSMFDIRTSVRENAITFQQLQELSISEASVSTMINSHGRGWVAEESGQVVGFCIADRRDGSIFALYVRPENERRGHGSALLEAAVKYLQACGCTTVWLTVGQGTHAHQFYLRHGWIRTGTVENGDARLEKLLR